MNHKSNAHPNTLSQQAIDAYDKKKMEAPQKFPQVIRPGCRASTVKRLVISPAWTVHASPVPSFPTTWPRTQAHPNTFLNTIAVLNRIRVQELEIPLDELVHLLRQKQSQQSRWHTYHPGIHWNHVRDNQTHRSMGLIWISWQNDWRQITITDR